MMIQKLGYGIDYSTEIDDPTKLGQNSFLKMWVQTQIRVKNVGCKAKISH